MIIQNVTLRNFRNYKYSSIDFYQGMNVITGKNAQGKTNLLESLVYLSLTRSHRILDDKQLIKKANYFRILNVRFLMEKRVMKLNV